MSSEASIELDSRGKTPEDRVEEASPKGEDTQGRHEFAVLPPVDRGKDAWLFLGACFVIEALVWGILHPFLLFPHVSFPSTLSTSFCSV